jgi:hypothetical protein
MLTIFSLPKPFKGHIDVIQRNAIQSWLHLQPKPEIILLGNDEGTAEVAAEFGLQHIPEIEKNEFGTPLASSIFQATREKARTRFLCYINADIILLNDFSRAFAAARKKFPDGLFHLTGMRWNVDVNELIDFDEPGQEDTLKKYACSAGAVSHVGLDYFIFPRDSYQYVKPFAVGRPFLDAWFVYKARQDGLVILDCSQAVMVLHQNHSSIIGAGPKKKVYDLYKNDIEIRRNHKLCGMYPRTFSFLDAEFLLTDGRFVRTSFVRKVKSLFLSTISIVAYDVLYPLYPLSYPILWLGSILSNKLLIKKLIVK